VEVSYSYELHAYYALVAAQKRMPWETVAVLFIDDIDVVNATLPRCTPGFAVIPYIARNLPAFDSIHQRSSATKPVSYLRNSYSVLYHAVHLHHSPPTPATDGTPYHPQGPGYEP